MTSAACTWKDCAATAAHDINDDHGKSWAHLCDAHKADFDAALAKVSTEDPKVATKAVLRTWVLAQGGAKKAAERMRPAVEAGARLFDALRRPRR